MLPDPFTVFAWGVMAALALFVFLVVKDIVRYTRVLSRKDQEALRMWRAVSDPDAEDRVLMTRELPSLITHRRAWVTFVAVVLSLGLVGFQALLLEVPGPYGIHALTAPPAADAHVSSYRAETPFSDSETLSVGTSLVPTSAGWVSETTFALIRVPDVGTVTSLTLRLYPKATAEEPVGIVAFTADLAWGPESTWLDVVPQLPANATGIAHASAADGAQAWNLTPALNGGQSIVLLHEDPQLQQRYFFFSLEADDGRPALDLVYEGLGPTQPAPLLDIVPFLAAIWAVFGVYIFWERRQTPDPT